MEGGRESRSVEDRFVRGAEFVMSRLCRSKSGFDAAIGGNDTRDICQMTIVFEGSDGAGKGDLGEIKG